MAVVTGLAGKSALVLETNKQGLCLALVPKSLWSDLRGPKQPCGSLDDWAPFSSLSHPAPYLMGQEHPPSPGTSSSTTLILPLSLLSSDSGWGLLLSKLTLHFSTQPYPLSPLRILPLKSLSFYCIINSPHSTRPFPSTHIL